MIEERAKSPLDRVLGVIAEVRGGEGATALALTANVFLLLTAYYIIKPVREELILAVEGGAEFKAYAGGASALVLLLAVPLYDKLVNRLARNRLIVGVTAFFIVCMVGFYFLGHLAGVRSSLGIPFFLWVGIFSMMVVAQFWGFANDVYTEEQGKRLFAIVGLGASAGAVVGSKLTSLLLAPPAGWPLPKLDVYSLLLVSAGLLSITAALTQWTHVREAGRVREGARTSAVIEPGTESGTRGGRGGFELVLRTRYLLLLGCFSLLFTFVNTNGEYILGKLVKATYEALPAADKPGWIGSFYGDFFFYVNLFGLLLQTFAVSRIVKYGGLRIAFFIFPVVVMFSSLFVVVTPLLAILRITKTAENATDYSLNNTVRNMLWLPTTTEMKYKAKQAVDTFMVRLGDVSSGVLVFLGTAGMETLGWSALSVRGFAVVNLLLCFVWLLLARAIVRENRRLSEERERAQGAGAASAAAGTALVCLLLSAMPTGAEAQVVHEPTPVSAPSPAPPEAPSSAPDSTTASDARAVPASETVPPSADASSAEADFPEGPLPEGVAKRPVPDLDGRGEPATSFGEGALWVPRILFSPLYVVSEYVIRLPLGALVTAAEEEDWIAVLSDFFTFDEAQKVGVVPTAYLEFDLAPSVGLYFFADDAFADDNDLRVHGAVWPDDWWALTVRDRLSSADGRRKLSLRAAFLLRPDYLYYGLGPSSRAADESRFRGEHHEAEFLFDGKPWRASSVHWEVGVRRRVFSTDTDYAHPNLQQAMDDPNNAIDALPPGFEGGFTAWRSAMTLALDTREPFPAPAHGVRLELRGEHAIDVHDPVGRRWVKYGGAFGSFADIGDHRVVALSLDLDFTDPIAGEVPFSELSTLGGEPPMQGFREGRLFDRSSAVATLEYRWPVWVWLDMSLHYAMGNVFAAHLSDFDTGLLRSSFGLGLRSARTDAPDHALNFLLAFGTETLDQGHHIDTVRLAVGGTSGF